MSFIKEFKEFAVKGNLIDFAIGVVVGGAFGKVTTAFVDGMVMPIVGKLIGGQNFSDLKYKIQDGSKEVLDSRIPKASNQSVIVDSDNYIWIFGGIPDSGTTPIVQVWKGRLNKLNTK